MINKTSPFVKKPERIMGLLMVMTLALLVYSIAQRRLHKALKELQETLPNQIRKETAKANSSLGFPTFRGNRVSENEH